MLRKVDMRSRWEEATVSQETEDEGPSQGGRGSNHCRMQASGTAELDELGEPRSWPVTPGTVRPTQQWRRNQLSHRLTQPGRNIWLSVKCKVKNSVGICRDLEKS